MSVWRMWHYLSLKHLINYTSYICPQSIMVSHSSLREVNQLREMYCSDFPLYTIPSNAKAQNKNKLTGTTQQYMPLPKKHAPSRASKENYLHKLKMHNLQGRFPQIERNHIHLKCSTKLYFLGGSVYHHTSSILLMNSSRFMYVPH